MLAAEALVYLLGNNAGVATMVGSRVYPQLVPQTATRPAIVTSLKLWSLPLVERALARLDSAALDTRKNPAVGRSLAEATLFAVAGEAARVRSRGTRGL